MVSQNAAAGGSPASSFICALSRIALRSIENQAFGQVEPGIKH
jgi:hypothetical protein